VDNPFAVRSTRPQRARQLSYAVLVYCAFKSYATGVHAMHLSQLFPWAPGVHAATGLFGMALA